MSDITSMQSKARRATDELVNIVKWATPGYILFRFGEMIGGDEATGRNYSSGAKAFYYTVGVVVEALKTYAEYKSLVFLVDKLS